MDTVSEEIPIKMAVSVNYYFICVIVEQDHFFLVPLENVLVLVVSSAKNETRR